MVRIYLDEICNRVLFGEFSHKVFLKTWLCLNALLKYCSFHNCWLFQKQQHSCIQEKSIPTSHFIVGSYIIKIVFYEEFSFIQNKTSTIDHNNDEEITWNFQTREMPICVWSKFGLLCSAILINCAPFLFLLNKLCTEINIVLFQCLNYIKYTGFVLVREGRSLCSFFCMPTHSHLPCFVCSRVQYKWWSIGNAAWKYWF